MKVLLTASPRTLHGFNRLMKIPNIGLCSIAANIDRSLCDLKILDLTIAKGDPYKFYRKILSEYEPDVVGISGMIIHSHEVSALAKITKEFNKNITVIAGGYYPTVAYDYIAKSDDINYIDYMIRGEAEIPFNNFIKSLSNGNKYTDIQALSYRKNGSFVHNPKGEVAQCEEIKPPDRDSRILKKGFHIFGFPADSVESSRGCTFHCNFCCIRQMYGRGYRKYSIERVLDDIRDAKKRGAKAIMFTDDNITLDGKRCFELFNAIINAKLNDMKYFLEASISGFKKHPGLAETMAKAGVKWVFLGIENASDEMLQSMNKDVQLKSSDAFETMADLKKNGIFIVGGFVVGLPDETEESLWANYHYALKLGVDVPTFSMVIPHPGTEIREELKHGGYIINEDDFSRYHGWEVNVKTKHMSSEKLYDIVHKMELRYVSESGVIKSLWKTYPWFFIKMSSGWVLKNPVDLFHFVSGFFKKLLKKKLRSQKLRS